MIGNRTSLLDLPREQLGRRHKKRAATPGPVGRAVDGRRVNASLTPAVRREGTEITTVEGLTPDEDDDLHPLPQAFIEQDAFQCGCCTPGQIMSGIGCIREGRTDSPEEIREWMSGNICRRGCYTKIASAVEQAAAGK
ncbi:2Fe-2S iron-sulfur cluster-binding protein [Nonomuraea sp. NPDC049709]|uniref:(2Fe-2S)-binding protein n=1 Tax=Nonomuraea sp. NPDC049709 TaxID=3154736 RepID=UPI003423EFDA